MGVKQSVASTTRTRLVELGAVDSPQGQLALVLAQRLDANEDAGSAVAAMAKELRATLEVLGRTATPKVDPVDEVKAARERRQSAQRRAASAAPRATRSRQKK